VSPICLVVAGVVRATLPDPEFTLAWDHSVEKTRWEERYRATESGLVLTEARVEGSGAGMEPPAGATLRDGGWTWNPGLRLAELRLARSSYTRDYALCWKAGCSELDRLVGEVTDDNVVVVRPCEK
jgi:hypothetical protein